MFRYIFLIHLTAKLFVQFSYLLIFFYATAELFVHFYDLFVYLGPNFLFIYNYI